MPEEKKGFGGFGDMVSDISSDITRNSAEKVDSATLESSDAGQKNNTSVPHQPKPAPSNYNPPAQSSDQGGWKWLVGIGAVIVVIWIASGSGGKNQSPPPYAPPASTPQGPTYTPPRINSLKCPLFATCCST